MCSSDLSDAKCNTAATQQIVSVNMPPCAIEDGPKMDCVNEEIVFDASQTTDSTDDKLVYRWDFGDGGTAEGMRVKHKYEKSGNYQVTLIATDDSGTICDTGTDRLNVAINNPPVADAGKDAFICRTNSKDPLEVTFDGSGSRDLDGDNLVYEWDFGDGESAEGKVVRHTYAKGGEYLAKLTASDDTDSKCNKSTAIKKVVLNRAPVADAGIYIGNCLG